MARSSMFLGALTAVAMALSMALGCRSRSPPPEKSPPPPPSSEPPVASAGAAGALPPVVQNGDVIDLREGRVLRTLEPPPTSFEASDTTRAYLVAKDGVLRAYNIASGAEVWNAGPVAHAGDGVQGDEVLFFPHESEVRVVEKATGARSTWTLSQWVREVLPLGTRVALRLQDGAVELFDGKTGRREATIPSPQWGEQVKLLASPEGGFCMAAVASGPRLELSCFDVHGAARYSRTRHLRRDRGGVLPRGGDVPVRFDFRDLGPRYLVCSTYAFREDDPRRAIVVKLADGAEIARVEEEVAAVVERDDGSVDSLLVVQPGVMLLEPDGKVRWKAGPLTQLKNSVAVARYKSSIYVAMYSRIGTGSTLFGFDRTTGKVVWKGDFDQLTVAHSIYMNDTFLSRIDDRLVLRVEESAISGVQVFSLPDGRRIFSNMQFRR
jgi:hypothetical protein